MNATKSKKNEPKTKLLPAFDVSDWGSYVVVEKKDWKKIAKLIRNSGGRIRKISNG